MKSNNEIFRVPQRDLKSFEKLVRQANKTIFDNLEYIQREEIKDSGTKRTILGRMYDTENWAGQSTPFSKGRIFKPTYTENGKIKTTAEEEYKAYKRMLKRFGGRGNEHSIEALHEGYYRAIISGIETLAVENGAPIFYKNGQLPVQIRRAVKSMSLEQMKHFFDQDVTEDVNVIRYIHEDYMLADTREDFVTVILNTINGLKETYPTKFQRRLRDIYGSIDKYKYASITDLEKVHAKNLKKQAKNKSKSKRKKKK